MFLPWETRTSKLQLHNEDQSLQTYAANELLSGETSRDLSRDVALAPIFSQIPTDEIVCRRFNGARQVRPVGLESRVCKFPQLGL